MDPRLGTPKDLTDAIVRGLEQISGTPVNRGDPIVKDFHAIIQDRLAQSFQAYMCKQGTSQHLMPLWQHIFPKQPRQQ